MRINMAVLHILVKNVKEATTKRKQTLKAYEEAFNNNDKDVDKKQIELDKWDQIYWNSLNELFDYHSLDKTVIACALNHQVEYGSWI